MLGDISTHFSRKKTLDNFLTFLYVSPPMLPVSAVDCVDSYFKAFF